MTVFKAVAVLAASASVALWAVWRWACGYDAINRSDHYERRNY